MNGYRDCGPEIEAQIWLWEHKVGIVCSERVGGRRVGRER